MDLYFKLLSKNPALLYPLIELLPQIDSPSVRTSVLRNYALVLDNTLLQAEPQFCAALAEQADGVFFTETLNILSQVSFLDPTLKEFLMGRLLEGQYMIVPFVASHMDMASVI